MISSASERPAGIRIKQEQYRVATDRRTAFHSGSITEQAMSAKPRTRFLIDVDGTPRELFSVVEHTSGDLTLLVRFGRQVAKLTPEFEDLTEQRFSIHTSPSSHGFTFKQTMGVGSGGKMESAAFVVPTPTGLLWPLISYMSPTLRDERYLAVPRARDATFNLGAYDPSFSTLVYFVAVAAGPAANAAAAQPFNLLRHDFSHFSLLVFHTFMLAPSLEQGQFLTGVTSTLAVDGNPTSWATPGGSLALHPAQLTPLLQAQLCSFGPSYIGHFSQWLRDDENPMALENQILLMQMTTMFSAMPFEQHDPIVCFQSAGDWGAA